MTGDALIAAPKNPPLLRPVGSPQDLLRLHDDVARIIRDSLTEKVDYGTIPGTDKPTLLKPGAEKLAIAFGLVAEYDIVEAEKDHDRTVAWQKKKKRWGRAKGEFTWEVEDGKSLGLYRYVVKARLVRDGRMVGQGIGACSSLESKYVDRPRDSENTVLKMAKKRALVDGILSTFGLSNRFTQDVEEIRENRAAAEVDTPPAVQGFDPRDAGQVAALREALVKDGVPEPLWQSVGQAMVGRPMTDLADVIARVAHA